MYLASNVHITFPEHRGRSSVKFLSCSSFHTIRGWKQLTDTCEFIIAKEIRRLDGKRVFEMIKAGDPFILEAGYNGNYNQEFNGYISEVLDDYPVRFKAEDNMYILKRTHVNKSFTQPSLSSLLHAIVPKQFKIDAANTKLGDFVFKHYTVAQVLQELKDHYGIYSYFVGDTLISGKIFVDNPQSQTVKLHFHKNIINNNLHYRSKDDYQIKVTIRSHLSNGKRKKVTVGDPDGVEVKLVTTGVSDESALRQLATKELNRLKYDGYRGTVTTYGIPYIEHGYTIDFINLQNQDRSGRYYVDHVVTVFENKGAIRRTSTIGPKAS